MIVSLDKLHGELPRLSDDGREDGDLRDHRIISIKAGLSRNPNDRDREAFKRLVYDNSGEIRATVGDLLDNLEDFFNDTVPTPYERFSEDPDEGIHIQAAVHETRDRKPPFAVVQIEHEPH
jgi:hypothetical protein